MLSIALVRHYHIKYAARAEGRQAPIEFDVALAAMAFLHLTCCSLVSIGHA